MSGLQRIILIDTHLPGMVELKVDGHTNICGTNASGKTTLQRLLPVFYGEAPSKVVPATRDNFQTWYLPRESSFIIYEYQRLSGKTCMAVLTASNHAVVFRFIDKGFDIADFIAQDIAGNRAIPISEIVRNMRKDNVITSKALNNKEYRSVIQNDRTVMATSNGKKELLTAARYFSLCEADANLRHIEKLIRAVHSKEGKMETIKAMIAAILEEDGVQPPASKISKIQVEEWIKECALIQEFEHLMPQYKKLQSCELDIVQTEQRLAQLKQQLSRDLSLLSKQLNDDDNALAEAKQAQSEQARNWEQKRDAFNQNISVAKAELSNAEQHLDQIESEFNDWQDQDIERHQANLKLLPQWQSDYQSVTEQHSLLTEEHQDIEAAYHKRLAALESKQSREFKSLNTEEQQLAEQLRVKQLDEQQALQGLLSKQQLHWQQTQAQYQEQINDSKLAVGTLQTQVSMAAPSFEEQQALALLDSAIEEAQLSEDHARHELNHQQQNLQQLKYQQIGANESLNNARQIVKQRRQHLEQVQAWLYPGDNTLLSFLRKEIPDWEQTLGRVINPELLSRSDLAPAKAELPENLQDTQKAIFNGIVIDYDAIDPPEIVRSQEQLKTQLASAEVALSDAQTQQENAEEQLAALTEQVKEAEQTITTLTSQCQFKADGRKRAQEERQLLKEQHRQMQAERKQGVECELTQQQKSLEKLQLSFADAKEEYQQNCHDEKMEHEMHWQQIIGDIEAQRDSLTERSEQLQVAHRKDKKDCKRWYEDELANRDVDVDKIAKLKQSMATLKSDIEATNRHRDAVAQYQRWYQLVFTKQKSQYLEQSSKAKTNKAEYERQLNQQDTEYVKQKQALRREIQTLEGQLSTNKEASASIQSLKHKLNALLLADVEPKTEQGTVTSRISEAQQLLDKQRQLAESLEQYIQYFDNAIGQKSGTGLTEIWEIARRDCMVKNAQGVESVDARQMVSHLDQLLNTLVPQRLDGLRNNGLIFGNDLTQYYHILADIDSRIELQSKRISKEVGQELSLDGVSESSVQIRSKISEFDFWPKLKHFSKLHKQWLDNEAQKLPNDDYIATIREVLDVLGRASMQGGISQLLDIELHLTEGHSKLLIRTDRQLNESSSHGMAYLILCKFLLAFTRLLRGHSKAIVHWPIDEIGTLAHHNVKKIFDACEDSHIRVLGAFPNPESDILQLFVNRYLIDKQKQQLQVVQPKVNAVKARLQQKREQQQSLSESTAAEELS
ncbi:ATP-binding protein [Thalassotalea litorea]|uniref:ATP-binding protein n=1 Tax=Thalassotalea litorea TaxID=2020715 RepID=A0A5R9IDY7_9GAMM|nr:ATP-binding protein [Thalassotalea litorea]TLU61815.1 ATP-binding protein [Thalassotalea litorea]